MKREDGFKRTTPTRREAERRQSAAHQSKDPPPVSPAAGAQRDGLCNIVEAGHVKAAHSLARRLRGLRALKTPWSTGDFGALAAVLEASRDEALVSGALNRLKDHPRPLPPKALARLFPVAQRLSQSEVEDHAVVAMRFVLQSLQFSWPAVAKSLRSVATPKATYDACEEAAARLASLFVVIKKMNSSVRIQKTNGPLVAVCRKLKSSLEEALASAGKSRQG